MVKRVRSSSGQSQNCVRLGTSRDKKCLFQVASSKFFDDHRVLRKNIAGPEGFLRKEMRICAVVGISCRNGGRGFALRIIAIVQVRTVQVRTVHVLTFFSFILFQH